MTTGSGGTGAPTPSPTTGGAAPTGLAKVASGVAEFEAKFKADFADLSATAKGLMQQALAVAESEGSVVAGALKAAVSTVKGTRPGK